MDRAKNTTALVAILVSSVAVSGAAKAQDAGDGAIMGLVNCVMSDAGGPPCPTGLTDAEIDEVVGILAERTGETPDAVRARVMEALGEAGEAETAAEAEPEPDAVEAPPEQVAEPVPAPSDEATDAVPQPPEQAAEPAPDVPDETAEEPEMAADDALAPDTDAGAAGQAVVANEREIAPEAAPEPQTASDPATEPEAETAAEPRSGDATAAEAAPFVMPGPDATAQEIAAALPGLEDGEERDELLRRLEERLAEDAEAAVPENVTEAEAPDPEERERRVEMAEQSSEAALASQALAAVDEEAGADADRADVLERDTEVVTEETARSSDEDIAAAVADTRDEDDRNRTLRNVLGAAAAGFVIGQLLESGDQVVEDAGDRVIVNRDGEYVVLRDENTLLRRPGSTVETDNFADGSSRMVVRRDDGSEVVTVRAADGRILYRARVEPDGRRVVLIDERGQSEPVRLDQLPETRAQALLDYDAQASADELARALRQADRAQALERTFSLRQVRDNRQLRELMPRIDLDSITFDTGSAAIRPSQARELSALGAAMAAMIDENPDELFLIEGHTDTVGGEIMNLALSDRRAESVALALTEYYDIPPENLVTQGYGERYLKYPIEGDVRENRRAAVRRITPLLRTAQR